MTLRSTLALTIAALAAAGCSDSTEPTETVRGSSTTSRSRGTSPYVSSLRLYGAALDGSAPRPGHRGHGARRRLGGSTKDFPRGFPVMGSRLKVAVRKKDAGIRSPPSTRSAGLLSIDPVSGQRGPGYPRARRSRQTGPSWRGSTRGFLNLAAVEGGGFRRSTSTRWARCWRGGRGAGRAMVGRLAYVTWHSLPDRSGHADGHPALDRRLSDGFARPVANLADVVPELVRPGRGTVGG